MPTLLPMRFRQTTLNLMDIILVLLCMILSAHAQQVLHNGDTISRVTNVSEQFRIELAEWQILTIRFYVHSGHGRVKWSQDPTMSWSSTTSERFDSFYSSSRTVTTSYFNSVDFPVTIFYQVSPETNVNYSFKVEVTDFTVVMALSITGILLASWGVVGFVVVTIIVVVIRRKRRRRNGWLATEDEISSLTDPTEFSEPTAVTHL
ncbi:hypothetical protein C9374_013198 [Naegleria lovaniensis]|uniref:Uncharacterized protein n=1 Tax=Naegleria lovaniensis TaxID=51637 RepID=A0AA88G9P5_NAELO|nr:uncharacterized protein C9374_013198 [Naegleria lovaniensis]KAG2372746.1 hypothetical protein C9374_013198 [Naegleria lovaniensis]